jgi:hypothetical protein
MRICIGVMFVTVIATAALVWPGTGAVVSGLLVPKIPDLAGKQMEIEEVATAAGGGSFYRVLTAPYASDPDAQEACNQIRSEVRTHDCSVVAR